MRLISEGKLEELKQEYHVEFEVKENQIIFGQPEFNSPFPIEWALILTLKKGVYNHDQVQSSFI